MTDAKTTLAHERIADIRRSVAIITRYVNARSLTDWGQAGWGMVGDLGRLVDQLRDITEWAGPAPRK